VLRLAAIALTVLVVVAIGAWLNIFRSFPLLVQGIGQERHPVEFDFEFAGLAPGVRSVPVGLLYMPKTPILGITAHYWSIIAPFRIDTISRSLHVDVRDGHVRWEAPLGLAGLSNFRLQTLAVGEDGAPYAVQATIAEDPTKAPRSLDVPKVVVRGGEYRFDGAAALWRRPGNDDTNPYAYSPNSDGVNPAQVIWDGLRALHARIDLVQYPMASLVAPVDWVGDGWKNEGYRRTRRDATLTETLLTIEPGAAVPLPFARECESSPEFVIVARDRIPAWSQIDGLWRPVPRSVWERFRQTRQPPEVSVRFVPSTSGHPSLGRVESFAILARSNGAYRLFAACSNSHYESLGVTWIDVDARPASAQGA
jgi:hypothetical protein